MKTDGSRKTFEQIVTEVQEAIRHIFKVSRECVRMDHLSNEQILELYEIYYHKEVIKICTEEAELPDNESCFVIQ